MRKRRTTVLLSTDTTKTELLAITRAMFLIDERPSPPTTQVFKNVEKFVSVTKMTLDFIL